MATEIWNLRAGRLLMAMSQRLAPSGSVLPSEMLGSGEVRVQGKTRQSQRQASYPQHEGSHR